MATQIQTRRDSAADWTSNNPTLANGEMGLETDTLKFKFGDGSTAWTSLSYASTAGTPEGTAIISTGETGGSKFLREDGDGTCSWQAAPGGGDLTLTENADGFTISGGSSSERDLTVTGGDITLTGGATTKGDLLVSDGTDYDAVAVGSNDQTLVADSAQANGVKYVDLDASIQFIIDGGGSAITTGVKGDIEVPFDCTIESVTLLADQSGSIVVDVWNDTYANFPATNADSITASAVPTISTATKSQDATLTGWTTALTKGDILRFNVDSITTCTRVTLSLKVRRNF